MTRRLFERHRLAVCLVAGAVLTALWTQPTAAQSGMAAPPWNPEEVLKSETYVHPPAVVERIITAPRTDISFTNPDAARQWFLRVAAPDRGDVQFYGKGHIYLGGLQVDTMANRSRTLTDHGGTAITLVDPRTQATKTIAAPRGAAIVSPAWSPNGAQIAFVADYPGMSHVFVADVATGKSVQVTRTPLLATFATTIDWTADGKSIVAVLLPDARGAKPTHGAGDIEDGPEVRLTEGRIIPQVMHASLLEDPHDKALLKYYTTGQLAVIDVKSKAVRKVGAPAMIRSVDASPDGRYFRVTRMTEPFSYRVPVTNFGSVEELWDASGNVVTVLNTTPLREGERTSDDDQPPQGGRGGPVQSASDTGKRNLQWNPVGPGMVYLQSVFAAGGNGRAGRGGAAAAGRGGPARPQPTSVRYMAWTPPYGAGDTHAVYEGSGRLTGVTFSEDGKTMFVSDSGEVIAVRTADPSKRYHLGRGVTMSTGGRGGFGGFGGRGGGRGGAGAGADTTVLGGALAMKRGSNGEPVVVVGSDDKTVFLSGSRMPGARWETQAPRPWVDKLDFENGQRARIFDSPADAYEEFVTALDDDYSKYIYTHETATVIADAYLRDTKAGTSTKLTSNTDVAPEVTGAQRKRFQITRERDGVKFWVNVTLPADWRPGTKVPGIIWFYPREYTSQSEYDRSKYNTNINKFPEVPAARPATATNIWVTQGYAFIEPDCPIMGDSGRMNDNYTRDLAENLEPGRRRRGRLRIRRSRTHGYRRAQLRGVQHGQRDDAGAVLQGGDRRRRDVQPLAHAVRVPERAPQLLRGAGHLPRHVAVLSSRQAERRVAHVSLHRGPERRYRTHQLGAHAARAAGAGEDGRAVHVSVRGPQRGDVPDGSRPVGALVRLVRRVREAPEAGRQGGGPAVGHFRRTASTGAGDWRCRLVPRPAFRGVRDATTGRDRRRAWCAVPRISSRASGTARGVPALP